ncbi:hypothetical protein EDM54_23835 [Brevibacillus borstelensis]|uniref:hypothetical protein n=1 Tax=Brevibacillus borstelensis TaxID=45462 RepID=UPI000F089A88|nr:hypothetical protein [Brevibacillus borstelensis]MED1882372.1 hypothetical protein [Brevibacillus borstelensis]RNB56652.1 hypothetical protein EDM54_23835 [Brevibacillus borstelensis]GED55464.1 hypothetical protein BBO01nite_47050 [Brevibacillus borstelensis]
MRYTEDLRVEHPNLEECFNEIEKLLLEHSERYVGISKPLPSKPVRLIGQNGVHYLQLSLSRSHSLIKGAILALNNKNPLLAILAVRAHFETTGGVSYLLKKLDSFYKQRISEELLNQSLKRLHFGVKLPEFSPLNPPDPINVMSLIDSVDEMITKMPQNNGTIDFRRCYDNLSEFSHPNNLGMTMDVHFNKIGITRFYFSSQLPKSEFDMINYHLVITSGLFIHAYDECLKLLVNNEELPILYCRYPNKL